MSSVGRPSTTHRGRPPVMSSWRDEYQPTPAPVPDYEPLTAHDFNADTARELRHRQETVATLALEGEPQW